jgi:hypothetical protein
MILPFPAELRGIPSSTIPRSLAIPSSSSRKLHLLYRVRDHLSPARYPQATSASLRVSSFFATSVRKVHSATSFPLPVSVPPSMFLTSSTVCSFPLFGGLFHPSATCKVHLSGFYPGSQPNCLVDSSYPHVVFNALLQPSCPNCTRSRRPPSGLCSGNRSVVNSGVFTSTATRSPLKFSLLRVFLRTLRRRPHGPSTHDLSRRFLKWL